MWQSSGSPFGCLWEWFYGTPIGLSSVSHCIKPASTALPLGSPLSVIVLNPPLWPPIGLSSVSYCIKTASTASHWVFLCTVIILNPLLRPPIGHSSVSHCIKPAPYLNRRGAWPVCQSKWAHRFFSFPDYRRGIPFCMWIYIITAAIDILSHDGRYLHR